MQLLLLLRLELMHLYFAADLYNGPDAGSVKIWHWGLPSPTQSCTNVPNHCFPIDPPSRLVLLRLWGRFFKGKCWVTYLRSERFRPLTGDLEKGSSGTCHRPWTARVIHWPLCCASHLLLLPLKGFLEFLFFTLKLLSGGLYLLYYF